MSYRFRQMTLAAMLLGSLWIAPAAPARAAPAYPLVGPGIEYTHQQVGDVPWSLFVVKIDRAREDLAWATTLAGGTVTGLRTVREQLRSLSPTRGGPVVAINGDFFRIRPGPYQGDPSGLHIVDGELVSTPGRDCFWIDPSGNPRIGRVDARLEVAWPGGQTTRVGLNEARADDKAVLFTPTFGPSTRTSGGREFVLEHDGDGPWLPLRVGQTYAARVRAIRDGGDTALASATVVLSCGPQRVPELPAIAAGATLRLSIATRPDLEGVDLAIGGWPILLRNGEPQYQPKPEEPRHPRTAIGWNGDHVFLIVVDGRRVGYSAGMTLPELADLCGRLGCTEAMNLDGGGSSTVWIGGRVVNHPSDGRERSVANALVVYRKAP